MKKTKQAPRAQEKTRDFLAPEQAVALIYEETKTDTNRGVVLVCTAILDRYLEKLLRMKFASLAPDVTTEELDFFLIKQPLPPLGSAGLRAHMARILGLIDKDTCNALSTLVKIRNAFAHQEIPPVLDVPLVHTVYKNLPDKAKRFITATDLEWTQRSGDPPGTLLSTGVLVIILQLAEMHLIRDAHRKILDKAKAFLDKEEIQSQEEALKRLEDRIRQSPV